MAKRPIEEKYKYDKQYRIEQIKLDPEFYRKADLWKNYRIRIEDFERMYKEQNGQCNICNKDIPYRGKLIAVDHCHTTGKVRSILCSKCNIGLGQFNEDLELMQKAINYLTLHKSA